MTCAGGTVPAASIGHHCLPSPDEAAPASSSLSVGERRAVERPKARRRRPHAARRPVSRRRRSSGLERASAGRGHPARSSAARSAAGRSLSNAAIKRDTAVTRRRYIRPTLTALRGRARRRASRSAGLSETAQAFPYPCVRGTPPHRAYSARGVRHTPKRSPGHGGHLASVRGRRAAAGHRERSVRDRS
jgi:hypothetical protein